MRLATQAEKATDQTVNPTKDFVGQEIGVGDTVVYAVRAGSDLWLDKIIVTQVHPTKIVGYKLNDTMQRRITIKNLHTCVVIRQ